VQELGAHFDISLAAVSQHLKVLLQAGLVSREACGKYPVLPRPAGRPSTGP
jgi:DNA-binding transcriptional ArsR family regulator